MRKVLLLAVIATAFFSACKKNQSDNAKESTAVITGRDLTKCYCCWGWIINIDNVNYRFDKIPSFPSFDLENISYPATVKVKWQPAAGDCSDKIDILRISY